MLKYYMWGLVSRGALWCYFHAPREAIQDELYRIHRMALKRAHTARMRNQTHAR